MDLYIEIINNAVTAFIKEIDSEYNCKFGSDFSAHIIHNTITWSMMYAEKSGQAFYDNFVKRYPLCKNLDIFTLSLLHEVGHLETIGDMIMERELVLTDDDYFNLHNERIATDWAGEYIKNNYTRVKKFDKEIIGLFNTMYNKLTENND